MMAPICVVTRAWRYGAGWQAQMIAQGIADAGGRVIYIAPLAEPESREPNHPRLVRKLIPRECLSGPSLLRSWSSLRRIGLSAAAAVHARSKTKVYLFTIPEPSLFTVPLFALLRATGAYIIFLVHDAEPHAWRFKRFRHIERFLLSLSYRLTNHFAVLTPSVAEALKSRFSVSEGKLSVIPHGPFVLEGVSVCPGQGRLLLFGTLRRNKGVLEVIQAIIAARKLGYKLTLVIAGEPHPSEPEYWELCKAAIEEDKEAFELHDRFITEAEIPELISACDAFILAYQNFESQSGVAMVAALAGRPVIGTRSGGLSEMYKAGMVGEIIDDPVTTEAVLNAVIAFQQISAGEWNARAHQGAEALRSHVTWEQVGTMYLRIARQYSSSDTLT